MDEATIGLGYDDLRLEIPGGLYPCNSDEDALGPGEAAAGRQVFVGEPEWKPVRPCESGRCSKGGDTPCVECTQPLPTCPVLPGSDSRMTVRGRILAILDHGDSYLARLRLRILAGEAPTVDYAWGVGDYTIYPPTGRELAEIRLDDLGRFFVCIERVPNFYLEVTASDELSCQTNVWAAETVFDSKQDLRFFAFSPTLSAAPALGSCSLNIDVGDQYVENWTRDWVYSRAFFPATMMAFEMRDFMNISKPDGPAVDIRIHDEYRAKFSYPAYFPTMLHRLQPYPCIDDATGGESDACYRPDYIYLNERPAVQMDAVDHEYGHRAHDAKGNGWDVADTTEFPEGVAEFLRAAKETLIGQYRGACAGRPWTASKCEPAAERPMERKPPPFDPSVPGTATNIYAAYLFDIWDPSYESMPEASSDVNCESFAPPDSDQLNVGFGDMWDTFSQPYPGNNFPIAGRNWTQHWINFTGWHPPQDDWRRMLTIAYHHGIYQNCQEFPQPLE